MPNFFAAAPARDKPSAPAPDLPSYKVLLVDDDEEIHDITRLVLADYNFVGHGLEFISACSAREAIEMMQQHPDIALILLDVVMEHEESGLEVVRHIREVQKNSLVRIILRTGQPGQAPEREVIMNYDINDYKEKTELTAQKLFTTVTAALRSYRDLQTIEENRKGLIKVIDATARLFELKSLSSFSEGVLHQLIALLHIDEDHAAYLHASSFAAIQVEDTEFHIISATGEFAPKIGLPLSLAVTPQIMQNLRRAIECRCNLFAKDEFVGYFETKNGSKHVVYMSGARRISETDKQMLAIYANNVAIAFDNIYLNREIIETQKNIVFMLGEVVERRSKETGNHVRRMTELSCLLARKYGLPTEEIELLHMAAPMHDVGKIGIPDNILHKPDRLTPAEYEVIKTHTTIGHNILKGSNRPIMEAAALIALQHHERWNGRGYPNGLKGEEIHIFGRITALADVVDALGHRRCYKHAWSLAEITAHLQAERGEHFQPELVDIFLANVGEYHEIEKRFPSV